MFGWYVAEGENAMKIKHFYKRTLCFILTGFILLAGFSSLTQSAYGVGAEEDDGYANYLKIIKQLDPPPYYLLYEHIQSLGDFVAYATPESVLHTGIWALHEYSALYYLKDQNNQTLTLHMQQKNLMTRPEDKLLMPLFAADMRTVNTDKRGIIVRGPLRYRYDDGHLQGIGWRLGGVDFYIRTMEDYPTDGEKTVFSRLLSRNYFVALAAYYELIWDIPLQPGETWFSRMQHIIWPLVVLILLIAACITTVCIFRRIRRKKAAKFPTQWHNRRCRRNKILKNTAPSKAEDL